MKSTWFNPSGHFSVQIQPFGSAISSERWHSAYHGFAMRSPSIKMRNIINNSYIITLYINIMYINNMLIIVI